MHKADEKHPRRAVADRRSRMAATTVLLCALAGVSIDAGSWVDHAAAQDRVALEAEMNAEFDARPLSAAEKRVLQLGLTLDGTYVGLLDGRWGAGSQAGMEQLAARTDPRARADGLVRNYHVAALASRAIDFIVEYDLSYRGSPPWVHRLLTPSGNFVPDPDTPGIDDLVLKARGIEINVLTSDPSFAFELHTAFAQGLTPSQKPYVVRTASRMVTARGTGSSRFYVRSDLAPDGYSWFTTLIAEHPGADPRLLDVLAASITLDGTAEINAPNGRLVRLVTVGIELTRTPPPVAPIAPEPAVPSAPEPQAPEMAEPTNSAGTAFFVNNTDLVTAKHVIEGCARVTFTDGTELQLVAQHPTLDLALLTSPRRSRDWIPVHVTGTARLGQRIVALGYPFFGTITTALNSTGGNVSALSGLADDPREITITAPIQPGNSGGPLLGLDGSVIGVVIAMIDKIAVAEVTGTIPENINYAVTGTELLGFLQGEGVSLPRQTVEAVDFDAGIPESLQRAVLPVICQRS
jgi:S1-C subfamily serine protease